MLAMPAKPKFPAMDVDHDRAVRRVAGALLSQDRSGAVPSGASDVEVLDVLSRAVEIVTDPSSDPESAVLALALDLLWPRPQVDGRKLIDVVEPTLRPEATVKERRAAYLAALAVLSAWKAGETASIRAGRHEDPRAPAETMLRAFGMKLERIAEFTDPLHGGADRVKHRIRRYLSREGAVHGGTVTPSAVIFGAWFEEADGAQRREIRPVKLIPGVGTSEARTEVPGDERQRGEQETE
jgi:hypothetical protein